MPPTFARVRLRRLNVFCFSADSVGSRWGDRSQYRKTPLLHIAVTGQLTESGVELTTEVGQARYRWDQLVKAKLYPDVALLFTSPRLAVYLPRSFFARDGDWAGAVELLRSKVLKAA